MKRLLADLLRVVVDHLDPQPDDEPELVLSHLGEPWSPDLRQWAGSHTQPN